MSRARPGHEPRSRFDAARLPTGPSEAGPSWPRRDPVAGVEDFRRSPDPSRWPPRGGREGRVPADHLAIHPGPSCDLPVAHSAPPPKVPIVIRSRHFRTLSCLSLSMVRDKVTSCRKVDDQTMLKANQGGETGGGHRWESWVAAGAGNRKSLCRPSTWRRITRIWRAPDGSDRSRTARGSKMKRDFMASEGEL